MTTNFSFNDINVLTHKQQFINDELSLRILQYDNSIAEMYFVNKGRRTNIPKGLIVTNDRSHTITPRYRDTQTFALLWSESYTVTIDNVQIVKSTYLVN
jgi:hypothetical protein